MVSWQTDSRILFIAILLSVLSTAVQAQEEENQESAAPQALPPESDQENPTENISKDPANDISSEEPGTSLPSDLGDYEEKKDPLAQRADIGLVLGIKLGGGFSQPFSELGSSFVLEAEIGYLLPLPEPIGYSIELFLTGQYAQPSTEGKASESDPRLSGDGIMTYEVTQQQLILGLGGLYRLPLGGDLIRPYAAIGARLYLTKTSVNGEADGESFQENQETATDVGGYLALGCDLFLGPGALLFEIQLGYAGLDGYIMRDTNQGALNLALGYRLIF